VEGAIAEGDAVITDANVSAKAATSGAPPPMTRRPF
jgi:hypothetical protein